MAEKTSTNADMRALEALGAHFDALAERREAAEHAALSASETATVRSTAAARIEAEGCAAEPGTDRPMGLPSPEAVQMATDAICRHFLLPETRQHPQVQSAIMRLAYQLMAYGLVPAKSDSTERRVEQHRADYHVLVVDDVADVLVTVGAFLVNAGFVVRKVANGDEALRLIASDPRIDVLVTDFAMPGLSGADLIAQAGQIRPQLRALVITGYPNADGLAELPPHTTILAKPFRRDTLLAAVRSLLGEAPQVSWEIMEPADQEAIEHKRD